MRIVVGFMAFVLLLATAAGPSTNLAFAQFPSDLATTSARSAVPPASLAGPNERLLIKFRATASSSDVSAAIRAVGGRLVRSVPQTRTQIVEVPAGTKDGFLAAYARNPAVERASAAVKLTKAGSPNDPGYAQQWALPKIAWDQAYGVVPINGSATIAVLDTGVDATHPDLTNQMVAGQSFTGGDPNVDPNGHGTALAGIAAASVNNGVGMAGVAYAGGSISSVQVLQADGTGDDADVVSGVTWAADNGANVILMGFSSTGYSAALADALAYAWSKGVVLVAATGNDGTAQVTYPAGMPNVIGVASTDQNDNLDAFSDTGGASVAAPGDGIYATHPGGGYVTITGTSAAAAETAGLAALLVASGRNNVDTSNQIRGAVDPVGGAPFGRIDVATALGASVTPLPTATIGATPTAGPAPTYVATAAQNGDGTMTVIPSGATASSTGNTFVFTFTQTGNGNMSGGEVALAIPSGWTQPQTLNMSNPGYVSVGGSGCSPTLSSILGSGPWTIPINLGSGCGSGSVFTVTYTNVTAPSATQSYTFTTQSKVSGAGGTLTNIASSPIITVFAANGSGSLTTTTTSVANASTGNTITFTYTAATGGTNNGSVTVAVPSGWTVPQTTSTSGAGFASAAAGSGCAIGSVSVSGSTITVAAVTCSAASTLTISYANATAPATAGAQTWQGQETSISGGTLTNLASSPSITVLSANGAGTLGVSPSTVANASTGNTLTFTYTAATGGTVSGSVTLQVPSGWTAPQTTTPTGAGYTTAAVATGCTIGSVSVSGSGPWTITVPTVTCPATGTNTFTIVYGNKGSGGSGATAPTTAGAVTWTTQEKSTSSGTLTNIASSPIVTVNPGAVSASTSTVVASPTSVVADGSTTSTITVTLKDANGNAVSSKTVTLAKISGPGTPLITPLNGTTTSSGQASFTVKSTTLGSDVFQATDTTDSLVVTQTATVTFTFGAATQLVFTTQPGGAASTAALAPQPVVSLEDANGNVVTSNNSGTVTVALTAPGGATLSGTTTVTLSSGVATFTNLSVDKAGTYTLTPSTNVSGVTGLPASSSFAITVGPVTAAQSTVVASPTSVVANGSTSSTITVTLKDAGGNPVSGKAVTLTAGGGSSTITTVSGTTNSSGQASFTVKDTVAEAVTYTAKDTADNVTVTQTASVTFAPGPASAATSTVVASPTSVVADGSTTSTITVTLKDANNNAVSGKAVTLTPGSGSSTITPPGSVTTNGSGQAAFAVTNTVAQAVTYTAKDTTDSITVTQTATVTFTPGPASKLVFAQQPTSAVAGVAISPAVTVQVQDVNGNLVTGSSASVTIAIGTNPGGGTLSGTASLNAVNGVASFGSLSINKAGVGYTLTATSTGLTGSTSSSFTISAAAPKQLVFATAAQTLTAGVASSPMTVQQQDQFGNAVGAGTGGVSVNLSSSSTGGTFVPPSPVTIASGSSTVSFTYTDTTAGTPILIASTGSLTSAQQTETVNSAAASASNSTVVASPTEVAADGATISTITVTLRDSFNNLASGRSVSLGQGAGHSTITVGTNPTNGSGQATFTVKDSTPETVTYSATDTTDSITVTQTATVTFITLSIGDTKGSGAILTVSSNPGMEPGDVDSSAVTITNNGNVKATMLLSESNVAHSSPSCQVSNNNFGCGDLSAQLQLQVVDQTTGTTVYSGSFNALPMTGSGGISICGTTTGGCSQWNPGEAHAFQFTWTFPYSSDNTFQATSASAEFDWTETH